MSSNDGETACNSLRPRRIIRTLHRSGGGRGKTGEREKRRNTGNWVGRGGKGE
jgi:hypothetical protein